MHATPRRRLALRLTMMASALAASALVGCSSADGVTAANASPGDDAASDAGSGAQSDAASDAGAGPSLPITTADFTAPPAVSLPFDAALPVSTGDAFDYDGALLEDAATGQWIVVFERFVSDTMAGTQLRATWLDGAAFAPSVQLSFGDADVEAGPYAFTQGGTPFLYFMRQAAGSDHIRLARARFTGGGFGAATDLTLDDAFQGDLAWPSVADVGGEVVLGYDHYGVDNRVARGDGASFGTETKLGSGVQGRVASFGSGALAYSYQNGDPANMIAYVRVQAPGSDWTEPQAITAKANVHDVSPFRRADGGVDLYYISSEGSSGFRVFRRAVHEDATLGAEELVSNTAAGSLTQPHPHRLHDGSIALVCARQVSSNTDTDTYVVHFTGDAPP